jgi:hypothetical protein
MSVFSNNLLLGAGGQSTGQAPFDPTLIGNSVWLDGSADFLKRTFGSVSNQKRFVLGTWIQRNSISSGTLQTIFATGANGSNGFFFQYQNATSSRDDRINIYNISGGSIDWNIQTSARFRDINYYHILLSYESASGTSTDRVQIYINGVLQTSLETASFPSLNFDCDWGAAQSHCIGNNDHNTAAPLPAYLAQTIYLDGKSIQNGDVAVTDFLDSFTYGTNGSQFSPKSNADIAALATTAGGNSFCLDFSAASVALSSGVTPTSNAGTVSGSLSNLTDGNFTTEWRSNVDPATNVNRNFTTEWRSNVDPATNVNNDYVAFDLGSAKDVKAVKITGRASVTGNYKVQFSDNGSDFTDTGTTFSNVSITTTANSGILDLTSDNPGSHRYWKLINISNSSGTSAWGFREIILDSAVGNLGTDASGNGNDFTFMQHGIHLETMPVVQLRYLKVI